MENKKEEETKRKIKKERKAFNEKPSYKNTEVVRFIEKVRNKKLMLWTIEWRNSPQSR